MSHSAMRATNVCNLVFTVKKARTVWATTGKTHTSQELMENENDKPLAENAVKQHRNMEKRAKTNKMPKPRLNQCNQQNEKKHEEGSAKTPHKMTVSCSLGIAIL